MSKHRTTSPASLNAAVPDRTPRAIEVERITAEAQKAAFFYESVNDACPYPFATLEGATFKQAFNAARQVMNYGQAA